MDLNKFLPLFFLIMSCQAAEQEQAGRAPMEGAEQATGAEVEWQIPLKELLAINLPVKGSLVDRTTTQLATKGLCKLRALLDTPKGGIKKEYPFDLVNLIVRKWLNINYKKLHALVTPDNKLAHGDFVTKISFLPDGSILSEGINYSRKVWDPTNGTLKHILLPAAISVLRNNNIISLFDNAVRISDATTNDTRGTFPTTSKPTVVDILPNNDAIIGTLDGMITIWDFTTNIIKNSFSTDQPLNYLSILPDGNILTKKYKQGSPIERYEPGKPVQRFEQTVEVWNLARGRLKYTLPDTSYVKLSGNTIVTQSASDRAVKAWDAMTGTLKYSLDNSGEVIDIKILPNGDIALAYKDSIVKIFDLATGIEKRILTDIEERVLPNIGSNKIMLAIKILPNGDIIKVISDRPAEVWDSQIGTLKYALNDIAFNPWMPEDWNPIKLLPTGDIAYLDKNGGVTIRDSMTGNLKYTLDTGDCRAKVLYVSPNGDIVTGGAVAIIWRNPGKLLKQLVEGPKKASMWRNPDRLREGVVEITLPELCELEKKLSA